ncbi:MAG: ATP-binding protein [Gammaproteobacteria bacterium]
MKYPERSRDLTCLCTHYVLLLRSIAFWGHALILWILTKLSDQPFPYAPVFTILIVLGLFTIVSWWWAEKVTVVSDRFVFIQLLVDIFALSLLLYSTGGASNPFVSLFMLPVTFAAAMLRPFYIWTTAGIAIVCYTTLMAFYEPMMIWQHHGHGFALHVWGMWAAFLLASGLVAYFVSRIGHTLKARDQLLAEAREHALESEKLVALGSLAAGTAHELGTPLATIAILSKELEKATAETPVISKKMTLLRSQIDRCKEILSRMAASAGQSRADSGELITVDHYLEKILQEWLKIRPEVVVESQFKGTDPAPKIIADQTITQAIINILNNASDASSDLIKIEGVWTEDNLELIIQDNGTGLSPGLEEKVGTEPFISTKSPEKGLGLGLYLARTTLARLGGDVSLENRINAPGVTAKLNLPLNNLTSL